jgi:tricorn protease-like protein
LSPGSWSPDGRKLTYEASSGGNSDVFTVDVSGGTPRQLTFDPAADAVPFWSRDGRWIYFSSTRAGSAPDVWRIPAGGGQAVRITYHGGYRPQESPDGRYLYYVDRLPPAELVRPIGKARLMRVPVTGGDETAVLDGLTPMWWSVASSGIFFITRDSQSDAIDRYDFHDGKATRVGRLAVPAGLFGGQMCVSPDGRSALVTQHEGHSELLVLDNVR